MKSIKSMIAMLSSGIMLLSTGTMPCAAAEMRSPTVQPVSEETASFYQEWKEKYLTQDPYVTGGTQYYVWYGEEKYTSDPVAVTVSEAHGYGMLITACMADYDEDAKEIFDGMYRFYRAHLSEIGPNLMAWQQEDNGSAIVNCSGADSASDGDMDIAYALLLADSIWGSDGEINYKQTAVDMVNDIMEYEVNQTDWIIQLGDWAMWSEEGDPYYAATRASDFLVQYIPVFAEASGDDRWMNVYEGTYAVINSFMDEYQTGILPDFIVKDESGKFVPAEEYFLESEHDGHYYYNSCRTPWRISMDYLVNGNEDALAFARTITNFMIQDTGGDPWEIMAGYTPDGTSFEEYNDLCFTAPFLVAAACTDETAWHDEVRSVVLNYGDDVYYGDTIKMLCLIADDGAWIVPESGQEPQVLLGDVNLDGSVSVADAVLLRKYLVGIEILSQEQLAHADVHADAKVNVYDLSALKTRLLSQ